MTLRGGWRRGWRLLALGLLAAGCASGAVTAPVSAPPPSLVDAKRQVAEYVDSGRYESDVAAAVAPARAYLESRLARGGKLAIVLDIDETALSNLPSLRANDWGFILGGPCEPPSAPCGLGAWIGLARSEPIKPVLALARFARERGVAVFFLEGGGAQEARGGHNVYAPVNLYRLFQRGLG
jgi:acid phosphatase